MRTMRDLVLIVAHCREPLTWLQCGIFKRVYVYEKCLHTPALVRPTHGGQISFLDLVEDKSPADWSYRNRLTCARFIPSDHRGREAEAYLHYIVSHYDAIDVDTHYLFMQGSGMHECGRVCDLSIVRPSLRYRSLSAFNRVLPADHALDPGEVLASVPGRRTRSTVVATRATFIVRGVALRAVPLSSWSALLHWTRTPNTSLVHVDGTLVDNNQARAIKMEHAWNSLFDCHSVFDVVPIECYANRSYSTPRRRFPFRRRVHFF